MTRGMEHPRAKAVLKYGTVATAAMTLGALPGILSQGSKIADTPAAADTSQFIPPACDSMPHPHTWELPLCQKMANLGRNILAAYNDGDIRDNDAYKWKLTQHVDGFSVDVSGELPGQYSARYHRLTMGVQLVAVEETVQVTDNLRESFTVETEPVALSPQSQLHFTATKPGATAAEVPTFLFDSHTQGSDTAAANAMAVQVTPIVAGNGVITVQ